MSITKLSRNWACQMGPIHCPKFLLPGKACPTMQLIGAYSKLLQCLYSSLFDSASPVDDDASSTVKRCSNGAPLMLVYRKLITTCISVLLSVVSSMIVPRVHTESIGYRLAWLQKQ